MEIKDKYKLKSDIGKILNFNSLYNILPTNYDDVVSISFIDFNNDKKILIAGDIEEMLLSVFNKKIKLETVSIEIKNDDLLNTINNYLFLEFIKTVNNLPIEIIEYDDIKLKVHLYSNIIAASGRIGPANFLISNKKINESLLKNNNNINLNCVVYDDLNNDIILGRKNSFDQPGINLVLNENSLENITYNKNKKYVNLIYKMVPVGFSPEKQFVKLKLNKANLKSSGWKIQPFTTAMTR